MNANEQRRKAHAKRKAQERTRAAQDERKLRDKIAETVERRNKHWNLYRSRANGNREARGFQIQAQNSFLGSLMPMHHVPHDVFSHDGRFGFERDLLIFGQALAEIPTPDAATRIVQQLMAKQPSFEKFSKEIDAIITDESHSLKKEMP